MLEVLVFLDVGEGATAGSNAQMWDYQRMPWLELGLSLETPSSTFAIVGIISGVQKSCSFGEEDEVFWNGFMHLVVHQDLTVHLLLPPLLSCSLLGVKSFAT